MTCPFKSNKNAAGDGLARLSGINTSSHLKAIGKPRLIGSSSWKPGLRVLLQMHPVPTDTKAIGTALWMPLRDPYGPDSRAFWDLQTQGKSGTELVCFHCAFPPSLTMEIYHTIGCSFIFALCLFFPQFLPALLSVSISTLFQDVPFQNCFCAFFSGHQSTRVSPFSPPSFPFSLPSCLSWDRSSGLVAICCLFFFFMRLRSDGI